MPSLQISFQEKITELRACHAGIEDELTGRMPLAYTQLVQIMVDSSFSPRAALVYWLVAPAQSSGRASSRSSISILSLAKIFSIRSTTTTTPATSGSTWLPYSGDQQGIRPLDQLGDLCPLRRCRAKTPRWSSTACKRRGAMPCCGQSPMTTD